MENTSSETAKKILEKKELTDEIKEELKLKIEEFKRLLTRGLLWLNKVKKLKEELKVYLI